MVALARQPTLRLQAFRRQHPVGQYFADFFCREAELIAELDGSQHADQSVQDELRTEVLRAAGYKVLRFWNNEVISGIDEVLQRIADAVEGSRKTKKRRM